ncbi:MAG: histidine kinase dimerization/phospho-acceptor domain-containing protein [Spirochaetia bacterium]|nr:ATP-binding protein [Spirochaetota bacterium]MCX8096262.1 ATP-binding protein [Spirochaetota bacterium]MDW8112128.1 histidine kinase dimerization/phospho-acceptor domain-containing protein [Spirochaetia bacterium]
MKVNESFLKDISRFLSLGVKINEIFQRIGEFLRSNLSTNNFLFCSSQGIIYQFGSEDYVVFQDMFKDGKENFYCNQNSSYMNFDNKYYLFFDFDTSCDPDNIYSLYLMLDIFLKSYERFESIHSRFKYLKSLVFAIEPLIYEVSIKNAFSQSLISLTTFTDIEKAVIATTSGSKINVVSSIGVDIDFIRSREILEKVRGVIEGGEDEFFLSSLGSLVGIVGLGDFKDVKGLFIVVFRQGKSEVNEIDKEILKILSFIITHRIKLHEINVNLIKSKKRAEELSKLKSEFVANVSHELRTPLNAILGFVELLKMGDFSKEDQNKYLDYIMSAGVSLLNMINNILDLSKIEAGYMKPTKTEFPLSDMIDDVKKYGEILAKNKGISFFVYDHVGELVVRTDYNMLKSILINLVSNAIKFTDNGWVKLQVFLKDRNLVFKVEDTGIGIDEHNLKKIFKTFVQLEEARTKRFQGTGIGLSISKKFADMIGARIIPKTKGLGKGVIFYVVMRV